MLEIKRLQSKKKRRKRNWKDLKINRVDLNILEDAPFFFTALTYRMKLLNTNPCFNLRYLYVIVCMNCADRESWSPIPVIKLFSRTEQSYVLRENIIINTGKLQLIAHIFHSSELTGI